MILIALLIGAVLIVAAVRNSQGALFSALATDAPGYVVWAAAIVAVGAVGYIPGLKPISRGLLALVLMVIVLKNYQTILDGFQGATSSAAKSAADNASGASQAAAPGGGQVNPDTIMQIGSTFADFGSTFASTQAV